MYVSCVAVWTATSWRLFTEKVEITKLKLDKDRKALLDRTAQP